MKLNLFSKAGFKKVPVEEKVQAAFINGQEPPTGTVVCFVASGSIPSGWLVCDGTAVSRSTYSALFGVVGTTYGSGDGTTTFALPNIGGRSVVGVGTGLGSGSSGMGQPSGASMSNIALAATGGVTEVTLTSSQTGVPPHSHTFSETPHVHTIDDSHTHTVPYGSFSSTTGTYGFNDVTGSSTINTSSDKTNLAVLSSSISASGVNVPSGLSVATASGNASQAHTNIQPSIVLTYIIKT